MIESEFHSLIKDNKEIQKELLNLLKISDDKAFFNSEDQYPNGMFADFTIVNGKKVYAIVELKGSDIGVNEYVRGTGQMFQYDHFIQKSLSLKDYDFSTAITVFCFPSKVIENGGFNIGLFAYPPSCVIVEFNENNHSFRIISKKDLEVFAGSRGKEVVTVSPYYIRDTRLFEVFIALKYFQMQKLLGVKNINRKKSEEFLRQLNVPDNGNWRNVFITLSSLGLINDENIPTKTGSDYSSLEYEEFAFEIYDSYIKNYFDIIKKAILLIQRDRGNMSLVDVSETIRKFYNDKDVLFLTDSGTRYLSSWLNIMQEDFCCVTFKQGVSNRSYKFNYDIEKFSKKAVCSEIKSKSKAYEYIERFNELFAR